MAQTERREELPEEEVDTAPISIKGVTEQRPPKHLPRSTTSNSEPTEPTHVMSAIVDRADVIKFDGELAAVPALEPDEQPAESKVHSSTVAKNDCFIAATLYPIAIRRL
jgi:hypothetical protein